MSKTDLVIIRTKLVPPLRESGMVARERLLNQISESGEHSVMIIKAPAGYGKTTLVGQWCKHLDPDVDATAWYSLDKSDNDLGRFFDYLVASIRAKEQHFGISLLTQLDGGVRLSSLSLATAFLNEIGRLDKRVNIVLDDFHLIHNAKISDAMEHIIHNAPTNLRLVLVSREDPAIPLGRLRALGRIKELNAEELRFIDSEIDSFLSLACQMELSSEQKYTLAKHTEGWAAGLQLASISISNRENVTEFISTFSGNNRNVVDFLTEDVLHYLDYETREFLWQTAILDRLSPSLCNAVTKTENGHRMLEQLESKSLFLFSLDNDREWYRYHHLFSDFLNKNLNEDQKQQINELHVRASLWFEENGFIEEAMEHALAGKDGQRAAFLLDSVCDDLFYSGRLDILDDWYEQVPEMNLYEYPKIILDQAWLVMLEWKFELARELLDKVLAILNEKLTLGVSGKEMNTLFSVLKHREMMYSLFRDDMPDVDRLCNEMLEDFTPTDPYIKGNLYTCLIYARREMLNFDNVDKYDALAMQLYEEANSRFVLIWHNSILGPTERDRGHLGRAEKALVLARKIACDLNGENTPLTAMPGIFLAEIYYERNRLEEAKALLEQHLSMADQIGFVDQLIVGYIYRSRLMHDSGDVAKAKKILREGKALGVKRGFNRLIVNIDSELARQAIMNQDFTSARKIFNTKFKNSDPKSLYPHKKITSIEVTNAMTWCRLASIEDLLEEALNVCRRWIRFSKRQYAIKSLVQFNLILAQILQKKGETSAATRTLREALEIALSAGFIRTVVDEFNMNGSLLEKVIVQHTSADDPISKYASKLADILGIESKTSLPVQEIKNEIITPVKLNKREREILQLIANGSLNREIAELLGLTEGSVKWYLQQIYDKMGTRRRTQAVQLARELGFIR